jgi:hypothetical protein
VCVCVCVLGVGVGSGSSGFGRGSGRARGKMNEVFCPFPNSKPQKSGREGAYSVCLADVPKWGWVGGEGAWQSSPQGGSLKAIQFPC